jgi:hypothetical protein
MVQSQKFVEYAREYNKLMYEHVRKQSRNK